MPTRKQSLIEAIKLLRSPICKWFFWGTCALSFMLSTSLYTTYGVPFNLFQWIYIWLMPWIATSIFMAIFAIALSYQDIRQKTS